MYPEISNGLTFKLYSVVGSTYSYILSGSATPGVADISYDTVVLNNPAGTYYYVVTANYDNTESVYSNTATVVISGGGGGGGGGGGLGPHVVVPCFLSSAPVLTPKGYVKISELSVGDDVLTADGRSVAIKKVIHTRVEASTHVNPYVIPKGLYGATSRLLISPDHRVLTENGLIEAKKLNLAQESMVGTFDYYNLELPNWNSDNMVVGGVHVESMAPVRRITMTMAQFKSSLVAKYGKITPDILAKIEKTCRITANGKVECPVLAK
jgi:hypothetical protein